MLAAVLVILARALILLLMCECLTIYIISYIGYLVYLNCILHMTLHSCNPPVHFSPTQIKNGKKRSGYARLD